MFVALPGFIIPAVSGGPAAGTFISDECTFADGTDANNNYWSGEWNYSVTRADGAGGSYDNVEGSNTNGCWIPYGYSYSNSILDSYFSWNHGTNSGNFNWGYSYDSTYSDGMGGVGGGTSNTITAVDGTVVNSYGFTDTYPMTSYLKFLVSDTSQLHVFNYINAGTDLGSSCAYGDTLDASGHNWVNVNYQLTAYADGNGGSYYGSNDYNTIMCGYLPSGFWDSYSEYSLELYYYDEYNTQINFQYGKGWSGYIQDSFGNSNYSDGNELWYSAGHVFYSYYDSVNSMNTINYAFDGYSGYYTYTS